MMNLETLKKYGEFATWAIWSNSKNEEKSTDCIRDNEAILHKRFVLIGLNASKKIGFWGNFRGGRHDRKLKYAFNDCELIRGSYMTDLFKIVEVKSTELEKKLKTNEELSKNVRFFINEMADLGITRDTSDCQFLIFGKMANQFYHRHFAEHFPKVEVLECKHYSARGTDKAWVKNMWQQLGVVYDFEEVISKY